MAKMLAPIDASAPHQVNQDRFVFDDGDAEVWLNAHFVTQ